MTFLTIWEEKEAFNNYGGDNLLWKGYSDHKQLQSLTEYAEEHSDELRGFYLSFIKKIGDFKIKGSPLKNHLLIDGTFSYWWMTSLFEKNQYKSPRIVDCIKIIGLKKILNHRKYDQLTFIGNDKEIAQSIKLCCDSLNIRFEYRKLSKKFFPINFRSVYKKSPWTLKALLIFLRDIVFQIPMKNYFKKKWHKCKNSVFFFSYFAHIDKDKIRKNQFNTNLWTIFPDELIKNKKKLNFIHHYQPSAEFPNVKQGRKFLEKVNKKSKTSEHHQFLEDWFTLFMCLQVALKFCLFSFKMIFIKKPFINVMKSEKDYWLWPLLHRDWDNSFHGPFLVSNIVRFQLIKSAIKSIPKQSLGLYIFEGQSWERAFIYHWRKYQHGKLVGVAHSTISYWYLNYFSDQDLVKNNLSESFPTADLIAVNGPHMRKILERVDYPPEKIIDVEALRYLYLNDTLVEENEKIISPNLTKPTILILGDYQIKTTEKILDLINHLDIKIKNQYKFIFKPHPARSNISLDKFLNVDIEKTDKILKNLFSDIQIVISSANTAAAIEAFLFGKLLIVVLRDNLNTSSLRNMDEVKFVSNVYEIFEILKEPEYKKINLLKDNFFWLDSDLPRWKDLIGW